MITVEQYTRSLGRVRAAFLAVSIAAFAAQLLRDPSRVNFVSNLLCLAAFVPACFVTFSARTARGGAALVSAAVFLNVIGNSLLPMIGTLLEGHSVTYTLVVPVQTFTHRWIFAATLISAQLFARSVVMWRTRMRVGQIADFVGVRSLLAPTGIWVLGMIGLLTLLLKYLLPHGSVAVKVLDGFGFLIWAPYVLLVPPYSRWRYSRVRSIALVVLYGIHALIGIAANSRMAFIGPIATVVTAWLVSFLTGQIVADRLVIRRAIVIAFFGLGLLGQLKDFSTAILIERAHRSDRGIIHQAQATWSTFLDKEGLAAYESEQLAEDNRLDDAWKENYVRNPFLARFILVKYDDNLLYRINKYSVNDVSTLRAVTLDKVLAQIPEPILIRLGINVDKAYVNSFSMGDIMEVLSGSGFLGGFRGGSVLAHAYILFGWGYPFVLLGMVIVLLILYQVVAYAPQFAPFGVGVSTFASIYAFPLFLGLSLDGVDMLAGILLRNMWQVLFVYSFALYGIVMFVPGARLRCPVQGPS